MNSLFKIVTDSPANNDIQISHQSIRVQEMEITMSIGVDEEEKQSQQRVIIDVELEIDKNSQPESDNINEVISYADIIESIETLSKEKHYELVETFANDIAAICLNMDEKARKVSVSVQKPDIIPFANVGVTLTATK